MKNILITIAVIALIITVKLAQPEHTPTTSSLTANHNSVDTAFKSQQSNIQLQGQGVVIKILKDDNDGSRHQRFILKMEQGKTLLVAHNIDLAPKIKTLQVGDKVEFYGEYIWNAKGGVLHWTHHDPAQRHAHGWLKHQGVLYQ